MSHDCETCGESFETLSGLRLHDCSGDETTEDSEFGVDNWMSERGEKRRQERESLAAEVVDESFTELLETTLDGDNRNMAIRLLVDYEQELQDALNANDNGDSYRAIFWTYYEPVVDRIDSVCQSKGWPFVTDLMDAYDHREGKELSDGTAVVANLVARSLIRTRLTDGVDAVPADAVDFLASIQAYDTETFEIAAEESHHIGWAIGHPEVDVETRILAAVPDNDIWAAAAAERALYANQTSVSLFCELIETAEEIGFVLDRLAHFEGDPDWSVFPRGWDIETEFDRDFTVSFEPETERQLREAITARGYDSRLPEDWEFEDLEL
mgnify:CR=1 FL=1